jgi:hypothetical protein
VGQTKTDLLDPAHQVIQAFQEFLVSSNKSFIFGSHCVKWSYLVEPLEVFCSTLPVAQLLPFIEIKKRYRRPFRGLSTQQSHIKSITWSEGRYKLGSQEFQETGLQGKKNWHYVIKSLNSLHSFQATDRRGLIYAFLPLVLPQYRLSISYSTSTTLNQVLT